MCIRDSWQGGACLYAMPDHTVMAPAKFIRDHAITMWFSVPSVIGVMEKLGMLKAGLFPTLRTSLFCGEPLLGRHAQVWQEAAPHSLVENLYGPTEATIAITHYRWNPATSPDICKSGITPIGRAVTIVSGCTGLCCNTSTSSASPSSKLPPTRIQSPSGAA